MIVLTEQIEIPASYEKLKAWTANFEEEFLKWSPYHIECNLYNGNYHAGSKVRFREIVMGLDYDVTGTITECEQDENHFRIVFRSDKIHPFGLFFSRDFPFRRASSPIVTVFFLQKRMEDAEGNITAKRVGTMVVKPNGLNDVAISVLST